MVFQKSKGYAFKVRLSRPGRKAVTLGMGTSDPATAEREVGLLETMKARRRWDVIDALMDKRISLPLAYDNYESGRLDEYMKEISSPDLDPLVTEWSKTANAKYVKQCRQLIRVGTRFPASDFSRGAISSFLAVYRRGPEQHDWQNPPHPSRCLSRMAMPLRTEQRQAETLQAPLSVRCWPPL